MQGMVHCTFIKGVADERGERWRCRDTFLLQLKQSNNPQLLTENRNSITNPKIIIINKISIIILAKIISITSYND